MSIYTLAFVITKYSFIYGETSNGKEFRTWYRPSKLKQVKYTHELGKNILSKYENFFGVDYPLPKIDLIGIPALYNTNGAMENWGLVTYDPQYLLYNGSIMTEHDKYKSVLGITHELSHMWFGNLVTLDWWNDVWLNEGFARFFQVYGADLAEGKDYMGLFQILHLQTLLSISINFREVLSPDPIDVQTLDDISSMFNKYTSYDRGGCMIRMMTDFLSFDTFQAALTKYLKEYKYKNVVQDDLFRVLDDQAQHDGRDIPAGGVKEVMDTWTKQPIFPLVTVQRSQGRALVTIKQKPYWNIDKEYRWWIPLKYIIIPFIESGTNKKLFRLPQISQVWLGKDESSRKISVPAKSVFVLNYQQMGFYRVNYDEAGWRDIIQCLLTDHTKINPQNRAQILDDLNEMVMTDEIDEKLWKEAVEYLEHETEYLPWSVGLKQLHKYLINYGLEEELIKKWIFRLMDPYFISYSMKNLKMMSTHNILMMGEMFNLGCRLGHPKCIAECLKQYKAWMAAPDPDNVNHILPDLQQTVYVTAIQNGGDDSQALLKFLDERVTHLASKMKDEVWNPHLHRMKEAQMMKYGDISPQYLSIQYRNDKIAEHLDHNQRVSSKVNICKSERSGYVCDPTMDFITEQWDSLVLNIKTKRKDVPVFLHEIFGDIYTNENIEQMKYFKQNNNKLEKNDLAMLDVLIETAREKYEKMQNRMPDVRKMFRSEKYN